MVRLIFIIDTDDPEYVEEEVKGTLGDILEGHSTGIVWAFHRESQTPNTGDLTPEARAEAHRFMQAQGGHPSG